MSSGSSIQNAISYAYNDANTYYNRITNKSASSTAKYNGNPDQLKYYDIRPDNTYTPTLVDVGCICNSEVSNFTFDAPKYWDADTMRVDIQNANKMINDLEWSEQSKLHNGTDIQIKPGMVVLAKGSDGYIKDNVNFFQNITPAANSVATTNFNTFNNATGGTGTALDLFGYFHPDVTGSWTFNVPPSNTGTSYTYTYLWVGDSALYDYTADNANIKPGAGGSTSYSLTVGKDNYIPFRVQIISSVKYNAPNTPFQVSSPANPQIMITDNPADGGWKYFVTFIQGNSIYYKSLLYFGLVQTVSDPNKYNCHLVNTGTGTNGQKIRDYKLNPKVQYVKTVIPAPTTFEGSDVYAVMASANANLEYPAGVKITVNHAVFGIGAASYTYSYTAFETQNVQYNVGANAYEFRVKSGQILGEKPVTEGTSAYSYTSPTTVPVTRYVTVQHYLDVTSKVQDLIDKAGGNKLNLNALAGDFSQFGTPITNRADPLYGATCMLILDYSYYAKPTDIQNLYISLDSKTLNVNVGFTFANNYPVKNVMQLDQAAGTCPANQSCSNYKLAIVTDPGGANATNVLLAVLNSSGAIVGRKDLTSVLTTANPNFSIGDCQQNPNWANNTNSNNSGSLAADTQLNTQSNSRITSTDGKFKLSFENKQLTLTYCVTPYVTGGLDIKYKGGNDGTVSCNTFCGNTGWQGDNGWGGWKGTCVNTINKEPQNGKRYSCADVPNTILPPQVYRERVGCNCIIEGGSNSPENAIKYTTALNTSISDGSQILYLYRINATGLVGRKFLLESDSASGSTSIMHYLPNTYKNVLTNPTFTSAAPVAYPLMNNGTIVNSSNYTVYSTNISTNADCESKCVGDCEHYFFVTKKNATGAGTTSMCYVDKAAEANPMYTTTSPDPNIQSSQLYKKNYKITSTCGVINQQTDLIPLPYTKDYSTQTNAITVDYRMGENRPNKTYYCGLDKYIQDNTAVNTAYKQGTKRKDGNDGTVSCDTFCRNTGWQGDNGWGGWKGKCVNAINNDTTNSNTYNCEDVAYSKLGNKRTNVSCDCMPDKEGMANYREGFDSNTGPDLRSIAKVKIPDLQNNAGYYGQLQDQIGTQYDQTIQKLQKFTDLSNNLSSQEYKFNGTDSLIPDKFVNNPDPKPNLSLVDGRRRDVGVMLMQQNTMYTLASITAATCLILGVAFGGGGGE